MQFKKTIIMNEEGWPGIKIAQRMLKANSPLLDIIEESIKATEAEPKVLTVGLGGSPNALGEMELDSSIMEGDTLLTAAVGGLKRTLHPISVARKMLELQRDDKFAHVMLIGEGAKQFASEAGFKDEDILSNDAAKKYQSWRNLNPDDRLLDIYARNPGTGSHGTVIAIASNNNGQLVGGVSTSGWDHKYPGRLGDSPIIGAGLYVDSRYGAAACTHCGENAIRTSLARSVVLYLKQGLGIKESVIEGVKDLAALKGGYQGQVVIYGLDKYGDYFVAKRFSEGKPCHYLVYQEGMSEPKKTEALTIG
jgi:beta-aspartyl-peptidase (threonine type)